MMLGKVMEQQFALLHRLSISPEMQPWQLSPTFPHSERVNLSPA